LNLYKSTADVVYVRMIVFIFQADILDVNQIFRDLGMLVHEQGEVIGKFSFL